MFVASFYDAPTPTACLEREAHYGRLVDLLSDGIWSRGR